MFSGFAWALYLDLTRKRNNIRYFRFITITVLISFGLGAFTELLQFIITPLNRSGSLADLMSDFTGSVLGSMAAAFIRRRSSVAP
jgi:VanZ family protein